MRRLAPILLVPALALTACASQATPSTVPSLKPAQMTVEYAWVRTTDEARKPGMTGAFMSLSNPSDKEIRLVTCSSPIAGTCQIHEMVKDATGAMVMQEAKGGVPVPAGGHLHLKPGGFHVMLMDLKKKLPAGDEVEVTVAFDDGVSKTVKKAAEETEHYHAGDTMSPTPAPEPVAST